MNSSKCEEAIKEEIAKRGIKRNKDVSELYLANRKIDTPCDMRKFQNLNILWLNGNLLRRVTCLHFNERIQELYLHDNRLDSIEGALRHLTSLKVLFLQNNQLQKLTNVIQEFSKMQTLESLNLFHNPLAQDPEYRPYIIFKIPTIKLLDRQEVLQSERDQSTAQYDEVNELVRNTIAFGRRSQGSPSICYPRPMSNPPPTEPVDFEFGNNYYRNNPPFETQEQAVTLRAINRSIMEYTTLDWSKVPRAEERRLANKAYDSPHTITTRFR